MKLFIESNELLPALIVGEGTTPEGFYDGSTISNWDKYRAQSGLRFSQIRSEIKALTFSIAGSNLANWNSLTLEERQIASKYCVVPYFIRVATVGEDMDRVNWENLLANSLEDRAYTIERMRREMGEDLRNETLTYEASNQFYEDSWMMLEFYKATLNPSFKIWLEAPDGFITKPYYTASRLSRLLNIYNGGV
jgi:hypothetical protein